MKEHPPPTYDGAVGPADYGDASVMGRIVQDLVSGTFENTSMRLSNQGRRADIELEWTRDDRVYRAGIHVFYADDVTAEVQAAEDDWRESMEHYG